MKGNKTIFQLFETEKIQNSLPTESNHFTKPDSKENEDIQNKAALESFVSSSCNYFKESKHPGDGYFTDETDNECGSNFV
jgi:hypothetical protein